MWVGRGPGTSPGRATGAGRRRRTGRGWSPAAGRSRARSGRRPGRRRIRSCRKRTRAGLSAASVGGRHLAWRPCPHRKTTAADDAALPRHSADRLVVRGAREHNLKDVSLDLPRDALIVFTGLSGSGKSSLAFDTIFAEGQRRYVESLSSYARQFLGQMDKPDVDFIEGLSPAVSIDQKSTSRNPRSTVGTITEVYDYLRLLFARAGRPHCPVCGEPITRQTPQQIVDRLLELPEGTRFQVLAPVVRGRKGEYADLFRELQSKGFSRARVDGEVVSLTEPPTLEKKLKHSIEVVVDRLVAKRRAATPSSGSPTRSRPRSVWPAASWSSSWSTSSAERPGPRAALLGEDGLPQRAPARHGRDRAAQLLLQQPVRRLPRVHRHRHPARGRPGAAGARRGPDPGRGRDRAVDPGLGRLLPAADDGPRRPARLLDGRAVAGAAAAGQGRPAATGRTTRCTSATRTGTAASGRTRPASRARSRSSSAGTPRPSRTGAASATRGTCARCPCPVCQGARLKPESLAVLLGGESISAVCRAADPGLRGVPGRPGAEPAGEADRRAGAQGDQRPARASCSTSAWTTSRWTAPSGTLSGGEAQRIRLATQIGSGLVGVLYVLDEPSIGLHQRDNHRLIETLTRLRDLGNTLIVVEHDEDTIRHGRLGRRHRSGRRRARRPGRPLRARSRACSTTPSR